MGNKVGCAPPPDDEYPEEGKKEEAKQEEKIDIKTEIKTDFKIICAIDFGTDGVGLAYSIPIQQNTEEHHEQKVEQCDNEIKPSKDDENKPYYSALKNDPYENKNEREIPKIDIYEHVWAKEHNYSKQKAFILLNENNKLFMFGKQAVNTYECMEDQTGFKLFERFKMNLYSDPRWKKDINVYDHSLSNGANNSTQVTECNDEKYDKLRKDSYTKQRVNLRKQIMDRENKTATKTEIIFIETLKYLKKKALKYINSNRKIININEEITCDDIQWILTIPAIWSDKAKYDMKQWAIAAGLINPKISNQLRMALEPECAALDVQYLIFTKQFNKLRILSTPSYVNYVNENENISLKSGDKYILIDAGGGTVDIVSHCVEYRFGVREIVKVKGGAYSSSIIDQSIMKVFDQIFGQDNMKLFKKQNHQMWVQLLENCALAKNCFQEAPNKKDHPILLPQPFVNFMEKCHGSNLEEKVFGITEINNCWKGNDEIPLVKLMSDYLYLRMDVWTLIFNTCIQKIIEDCNYILENKAMNNEFSKCKYIFMVGGLSQNYFFQDQMIEAFGSKSEHKIKIILPINGILSVVNGAALMGVLPSFIISRILKKTYCIEGSMFKNDITDNMGLSKEFIDSHTLTVDKNNNIKMVRGILGKEQCFGIRGDEILMNHIWRIKKKRNSVDIKELDIVIYCAQENIKIPKTVDEAIKLGEFKIIFPNDCKDLEMLIEFSFFDTILTVNAYPINKPNNKTCCSIVYDISDVE